MTWQASLQRITGVSIDDHGGEGESLRFVIRGAEF